MRGGTQQVKDIAAPLLHRQDRREPPFALLQVNRKLPQVCLLPPHAQAIVLQLERDAQRLSEATGSFVLVVGFGRIGRRVARLVVAFGARVLASDPAVARTEDGVWMVPLDELVAHADVVTLHVPYTAETHHLIDAARLSRMAAGSILINVSRGGLVDETAVVEALECGHLAGAAFDTFKTEPYSGPLTRFEQVVLTAHMGSRAGEARAAMELEAVANLASALATAGVLQGE
ncbi:MAG: hypothetical protein IH987_21870 [Planctomycetes bacterium]|nr:hypothetical protein [Planctomycetota bacterium]